MRRPVAFCLAVALAVFAAGAAWARPPIWVAHKGDATVVLFGSVHVLPPDVDWEPDALRAAIAKADDVWFEIPLDDASLQAASRLAAQSGLQPRGRSLSRELSPASRAKLARVAARCGVSLAELDRLRPWLAEITLSLAVYSKVGAIKDAGVESRVDREAPAATPRRAFETAAQQIGYLAGAPVADQVASLVETLSELDEGPGSYQRVVSAWMAGDATAITDEALTPMMKQAPGEYRLLVVARNRRWLGQILKRLDGKGEAVMVVGVGHLVGPDSVPALLRARGISVEGP
ncbi:MAG TPA: TraB/GumN family protein [Caulobacteraceae bacterium]|nr:TraB/GumN family protein [Caulobacteraceae bacterium]